MEVASRYKLLRLRLFTLLRLFGLLVKIAIAAHIAYTVKTALEQKTIMPIYMIWLYRFMGFGLRSKKTGVEWVECMDIAYTVTTSQAPAVLKIKGQYVRS